VIVYEGCGGITEESHPYMELIGMEKGLKDVKLNGRRSEGHPLIFIKSFYTYLYQNC
jgi:hypothetical protein